MSGTPSGERGARRSWRVDLAVRRLELGVGLMVGSKDAVVELREILFGVGDAYCQWTVASLAECTPMLRMSPPDAVLVDLRSLAVEPSDLVRAVESLTGVPIVAMRGVGDPNPRTDWIEYGFTVLASPLTPQALGLALDAVRRGGVKRRARSADSLGADVDLDGQAVAGWLVEERSKGWVSQFPVTEILWIEAAHNGVKVHTPEGELHVNRGISRIAEELSPERFVRIHRSTIVNVDALRDAVRVSPARATAKLLNGVELPVSPVYWMALVEHLKARALH